MFVKRVRKPRPLRILQIISSSAASGAEKQVSSACRILVERGHQVDVVCPPGGWLPNQLRSDGVTVHEMILKDRGIAKSVFRILGLVFRRRIDLIHAHLSRAGYFALFAGTLSRRPVVATVHVINRDWVFPKIARGRNRIIAVSEFVRWFLHIRSVPDPFIDTVYNGTDFLDRAAKADPQFRERYGIPDDRRLFGLIGRICEQKGHLLAVEALGIAIERHPLSHLVLVGRSTATFLETLEEKMASLGIQEHVTIIDETDEVAGTLDELEFTILPSVIESFGVVAIESMARGKPVIASRRGALPEIVETRRNGLIADLNPESFAEAICTLLSDEDLRQRFGTEARRAVEQRFTIEQMVSSLESVYKKAVGQQ